MLAAFVAALCAALAVGLALGPLTPGRRAEAVVGAGRPRAHPAVPAIEQPKWLARWGSVGAAACAGCGIFAVFGGMTGLALGAGVGFGSHRLLRRLISDSVLGVDRRAVRVNETRIAIDLPVALDLLAAVLWTGATVADGLRVVGQAVGPAVGTRFTEVVRLLDLGAGMDVAWSSLLDDEAFGQVARVFMRAGVSGAPLGDALERLAADRREAARATSEAAAHRLGVRAVVPLGLCFLPAFVLVGVVPVVVGLARAAVG